jgi:hypothetical protein
MEFILANERVRHRVVWSVQLFPAPLKRGPGAIPLSSEGGHMGEKDQLPTAAFVFNGPVDATGAHFVNGNVYHATPAEPADPISYGGSIKVRVCGRLVSDWGILADYLMVPEHQRAAFVPGREPQGVWDWLEQRHRLADLREALAAIQRDDLVRELDADPR